MPTEARTQQGTAQSDGAEEPFIGRRRELKALAASLAEARRGRGRLDIVTGAPGIGKTRLTREVAAVAIQRGLRVLRGGCWEGEGAPAYWPWTDVLRNAIDAALDDRAASAADFGLLLQAAATHAGVPLAAPIDVTQDAQQARFMLFDRCCEFLAATAAAQPTLVIIDDAHWADTGSLLLLQFLAGRLAELPLALLITSREPLSEMAAAAGRHAWARRLALGGLSRAEAGALIEGRMARAPAPAMLDRLMRLTEGNPYFLKEIGQLLVTGEPGVDPSADMALPASLLTMVLQQYRRLSAGCRSVVQAAAVIGREFDSELVAAGSGLPMREVLPLLDEGIAQHIVTGLGAARYRFSHTLLREAIHEQLHLSLRAQLHEKILLALERRLAAGERVSSAALAHHSYMSLPLTDRHRAATHAVAAGQDAHRACAFEEAVCHFERAHDLARQTFSDTECCDVLLQLGAAQAGAGDWVHSRRTFEDAAALARRIDSPEHLARAALGFKGMMLGTIPVDVDAVALLQEALAALGDRHPGLSVELYAALSTSLYFDDDDSPSKTYSDLAVDLAGRLDNDRLSAAALLARLLAAMRPGADHTVRSGADDLLRLGIRLRAPLVSFHARTFRYWHLLTHGYAQEAASELNYASELASTTQHPRSTWQVALFRAAQAIAKGQLTSAPRLVTNARDIGRRLHDPSTAQHSLLQSFQVSRFTKEYDALVLEVAEGSDRNPHTIGYLAALALLRADLGQLQDARAALGFFAAHKFQNIPANFFSIYFISLLAEAVVKCNEPEWAHTIYQMLSPYASRYIVAGLGSVTDGAVAHYLALLAACMGDTGLSSKLFDTATTHNARLNAAPLLARTHLEHARFLLTTQRSDTGTQATQLATAASTTFAALGLSSYQREADAIAALASARPAPPTQPLSATGNAFVRIGDYWLLRYKGREAHLRHRTGFLYIASILHARGERIHVLDLVSGPGSVGNQREVPVSGADPIAKRAYKNRLAFLQEELALATEHNDIGRIDTLQQEREAILSELAYSYGISGRSRSTRSPAERARISVKNRISSALSAMEAHHKGAFGHLTRSVRTGTYCRYVPDTPTEWSVRLDPAQ